MLRMPARATTIFCEIISLTHDAFNAVRLSVGQDSKTPHLLRCAFITASLTPVPGTTSVTSPQPLREWPLHA